jgi:hypothetical protein
MYVKMNCSNAHLRILQEPLNAKGATNQGFSVVGGSGTICAAR